MAGTSLVGGLDDGPLPPRNGGRGRVKGAVDFEEVSVADGGGAAADGCDQGSSEAIAEGGEEVDVAGGGGAVV